ncbi:hypothetical protein CMUST_01960 [Corynebacterium mustelae]|uniref:Uncharacterized protein n=1 Tax=Corynebacterium mustelae TaxID=571915 RepID=A0A0G3H0Z6_9CORY|nr:hypothetical protein [Corynebacterium mustelae]AKK04737.1 hypothetical protein CMUST_01960 [Corynebacterium mustelae]
MGRQLQPRLNKNFVVLAGMIATLFILLLLAVIGAGVVGSTLLGRGGATTASSSASASSTNDSQVSELNESSTQPTSQEPTATSSAATSEPKPLIDFPPEDARYVADTSDGEFAVYSGNATTSDEFVINVGSALIKANPDPKEETTKLSVYSPVTRQTYIMTCQKMGEEGYDCRGGRAAIVFAVRSQ